MKILVVGLGAHVEKRIIPALLKIQKVNQIYVLTERIHELIDDNKINLISLSEIENQQLGFDLIFISNYPSKHLKLFEKVKYFGTKFIIEKPITDNLDQILDTDFKSIFEKKVIYESEAYLFHPLYEEVKKVIQQNEVLKIESSFRVPELPQDNYRYKKSLGGGSILDQGVYIFSLIVNLFGKDINLTNYEIEKDSSYEVDTSGSLTAITSNQIELILSWGINKDYLNELRVYCKDKEYYFPFMYSKPQNYNSHYFEISNGDSKEISIGNFDQFQIMFEKILDDKDSYGIFNYDKLKHKYTLIKKVFDTLEE